MKHKPDNSTEEIIRRESGIESPDISLPADNTFIAPVTDGDGGEYNPRHLSGSNMPYRGVDTASPLLNRQDRGEYIPQPDGSNIAPNGAVVQNPWSEQPEIRPDHEYTPEKEDLNLLIM